MMTARIRSPSWCVRTWRRSRTDRRGATGIQASADPLIACAESAGAASSSTHDPCKDASGPRCHRCRFRASTVTIRLLKNALDWLHVLGQSDPQYLHDKVIGLISAAGGTQGLQAINTMEFSVRALRGWAVPYVVPVATAARV